MNVAVRRVPDARLVVEDVVAQAAARVRAPASDEVLHPALLERARSTARSRRCGSLPVMNWPLVPNAVAGVGEPLPVVAGLRAVLGDREAGELAAVRCPASRPSRSVGMVSIAWAFAAVALAMKVSPRSPGVALLSPMLS